MKMKKVKEFGTVNRQNRASEFRNQPSGFDIQKNKLFVWLSL